MTATSPATNIWPQLLQQLLDRQSLSEAQAEQLMNGWLAGEVPDVTSGALLAALQAKGVTAPELAGMARVLQRASKGEPLNLPVLVDTCGTGGGRSRNVQYLDSGGICGQCSWYPCGQTRQPFCL